MMKESFSNIADTRQQSHVRHSLYEIIAMTIAGVIGNYDGWDAIDDFCYSKEKWLREHMRLELKHGIPSELPLNVKENSVLMTSIISLLLLT